MCASNKENTCTYIHTACVGTCVCITETLSLLQKRATDVEELNAQLYQRNHELETQIEKLQREKKNLADDITTAKSIVSEQACVLYVYTPGDKLPNVLLCQVAKPFLDLLS